MNTKKLVRLIREVEASGLEAARSLVFEELRTLEGVDPHTLSLLLRQVAEQQAKEGIVKVLRSFVATLAPGKGSRERGRKTLNSQMIEALIELLVEKKIVTREEILERITAQRETPYTLTIEP